MNKILIAFLSCVIFCGCRDAVREEDNRAYCLAHDPQIQELFNKYGAKLNAVYNSGMSYDCTKIMYEIVITIDRKQH